MDKTKVVATLGPASRTPDVLARIVDAGVDVVRLNLSHGSLQEHQHTLDALRAVLEQRGAMVGIMADLAGPKVRTGPMREGHNEIQAGAACTIVRGDIEGTAGRFGTTFDGFTDDVQPGQRVLIDDGLIRLRVVGKSPGELTCECVDGGVIGSRKGINVPDTQLTLPPLTRKDYADLAWAADHRVDFVALSFVRRAADLRLLRDALAARRCPAHVISKIETPQAVADLDAVIDESDAVLVARGDLGVEMDLTQVPFLQKDIVRRCRRRGRPVIIATQMLQSMVNAPAPTRAEVSDVANAVLDGADAVMLSAESAVGRYPVPAIQMMNRIARSAYDYRAAGRADVFDPALRVGADEHPLKAAVARSCALIASDLNATVIVVWCNSGETARWISKYQTRQPVAALAADAGVGSRLALCYGVAPMRISAEAATGTAPWSRVKPLVARRFGLKPDDLTVMVGDPAHPERATTMSVEAAGPQG